MANEPVPAYCGIDVAFAKRKALPVAICTRSNGRLSPLRLRSRELRSPPRGAGNRAALDSAALTAFAEETTEYLQWVQAHFAVRIVRVAIDAPRDYAREGERRCAERAMDALGISCFATPSRSAFAHHRIRALAHLASGGAENRLPNANQWWMLVGFALFARLQDNFNCIEVFPNAIVRALDPTVAHKSTVNGYTQQTELLRAATGVSRDQLDMAAHGSRHDRLDAVLSAWVASLEPSERVAHGDGGTDTIWSVPSQIVSDRSVA